MEVGWYLRFARTDCVVALTDKGTQQQLYSQLEILPEWQVEIVEQDDCIKSIFTKKKNE